ncbi:MAG: hypothetical protein B6D39_12685 [Anaerolineae bacterium UTCFX2]|jgi:uncharacterized membrane protein YdbT with pleckstrin-like domain|nr:cyclic nucleotide-binding domain-containing protein [Anaerolineae bacterium]MCZ7554406.1 cyclic nucleotide-binding domain-containing protein [Anaerolineales bacterium]OQY87601.1 MAG: hypothetical protein B6D39_12685 [Anaerolineae bacterium UTCFX2]
MQTLPDLSQISKFLNGLNLFNSLDEFQLAVIAEQFSVIHDQPDRVFTVQGQTSNGFYLIFEGQVSARRELTNDDVLVDVLVRGDFFGEDSLLENRTEPATVTALTPVTLLFMPPEIFRLVVREFPGILDSLRLFVDSHDFLESHQFDWLNEDEVVYQVRRRHVAVLLLSQILPLFINLFGLFFVLIGWYARTQATTSWAALILAAVLLGIGIGLAVWRWIDWGNDYYFVTNQRVVWLEQVIWFYENRQEVPMSTILSVNVHTEYFGRLFGFGDVRVTTYTGGITLGNVGNPYQLASLISEYQLRSQEDSQRADLDLLRQSIRHIVSEEDEAEPAPQPAGAKSPGDVRISDEPREPSWFDKYFKRILQTRFETGNTITYRKHWLFFFRRAWLPLIIFLVISFLFISFVIIGVQRSLDISSLLLGSVVVLIILAVVFGWISYHYLDWLNDIYQVTDRSIFDIEKKPLGTETRKVAPLDNILSLGNVRPGFIGYLLNVGSVMINVGETKFTFYYVHEPARVQQDIFNRMNALKVQKQREEIARERERILKLIEIYHEEVGKEA